MSLKLLKPIQFFKCCLNIRNYKEVGYCIIPFRSKTFQVQPYKKTEEQLIFSFLESNPHMRSFINQLTQCGIQKSRFEELAIKEPSLLQIDFSKALKVIYFLVENEFRGDLIIQMIDRHPSLLSYDIHDLEQTFSVWRQYHYSIRFLQNFYGTYPELLDLDTEDFGNRLIFLKYTMIKMGRCGRLLLNSPDFLYQNWQQLEYKFNYLIINKRVTEREVSDSKAITHSVYHIKLRYSFLDKAGVYKRPDPKEKGGGFSPHINPGLKFIVDTDDHTFACNVAKVNPDEYEVYKDLMAYSGQLDNDEPIRSVKVAKTSRTGWELEDSDDDDEYYEEEDDAH